jgi:hypothetical protein
MSVKCFNRPASAASLAAICVAAAIPCLANIPPPQKFMLGPTGTNTVPTIVSASVAANDDTARPYGGLYETAGYCSVRLTATLGPHLVAFFNVWGTDQYESMAGSQLNWTKQTPPILLSNKSDSTATQVFVVPLEQKFTEFFLSTASEPATPDYSAPLKAGVSVSAVATRCPSDEKSG